MQSVPFEQQTPPEQVASLTVHGLYKIRQLFDLDAGGGEDGPNLRLLGMQVDQAGKLLAMGQKQAASVIAAKTADSLIQLLDCLRKGERATFLDGEAEGG